MSLRREFERLCVTPSDIYEHLSTFVDLVVARNAQHVIELGTRTGVSTIAWLEGLRQTGGRLTSVDIDERPDIGDYDHWTFVRGSDLDPSVLARLDDADLIFVDTSHAYDQTVRELNVYVHLVRRPGLIVLHDTELKHPFGVPWFPAYPVKTAVDEFCQENGYRWTNHTNCFGLGIVEIS
jgi:predicted O-methyltransferase YrrM